METTEKKTESGKKSKWGKWVVIAVIIIIAIILVILVGKKIYQKIQDKKTLAQEAENSSDKGTSEFGYKSRPGSEQGKGTPPVEKKPGTGSNQGEAAAGPAYKHTGASKGPDDFPLEIGSKGDNVKYLQQALNILKPADQPALTLDGDFGAQTKVYLDLYAGKQYYPVNKTDFTIILKQSFDKQGIK